MPCAHLGHQRRDHGVQLTVVLLGDGALALIGRTGLDDAVDAVQFIQAAEAVEIANGTPYGLAGGVFSGDQERAVAIARRLRTGMVDVNGGRFNPLAPFGGYKQSGNGRELGEYGLEEFLEIKSLQL